MAEGARNKVCQWCKKGNLVEGTLEGVAFQPLSEGRKWLGSGVYGIHAAVCSNCGRVSDITIDTDALRRVVGTTGQS